MDTHCNKLSRIAHLSAGVAAFAVRSAVIVLLAVSCDDGGGGAAAPPPPIALEARDVTANAAILSWTANAPEYVVEIGGATAMVKAPGYYAAGLTPETEYAWRVRAKHADAVSDWTGSAFVTAAAAAATTTPQEPGATITLQEPGARVTFGPNAWTPEIVSVAIDYTTSTPLALYKPYLVIQMFATDVNTWPGFPYVDPGDYQYPFLSLYLFGASAPGHYENSAADFPLLDVEYYHEDYVVMDGYAYGDYLLNTVEPASLDIIGVADSAGGSVITGVFKGEMLDVAAYSYSGGATVRNISLTVEFRELPITDITP